MELEIQIWFVHTAMVKVLRAKKLIKFVPFAMEVNKNHYQLNKMEYSIIMAAIKKFVLFIMEL